MADDLDLLAQTLNRLIEQERFSDAQAMLPDYTERLGPSSPTEGGEESLKRAITVFHVALAKARAARAHMSAQLGDANRARAYTGESSGSSVAGWQILG